MPPAADAPSRRPSRPLAAVPRWAWLVLAALLLAGALLVGLATLDFGLFRGIAESALSKRVHRRVTIARIERLDPFSFAPRLRLVDVRVAEPAWVGGGDMAVVREATVRVPVMSALLGRLRPSVLGVRHARVALFHDAGSRANWRFDENGSERVESTDAALTTILLDDVRFTLVDLRRKLRMAGALTSDAAGFRMRAEGTHRGTPARAALDGAPVVGGDPGKPWPFRAAFTSKLAHLMLDAHAARPLDFRRFEGRVATRGDDLEHVDDLLLIGLVPTQPVAGAGRLQRDGDRWTLSGASATVGRSALNGMLVAELHDDRWHIDAHVRARTFDFDDLADAAGLARAAALAKRTGPRIIPNTRIDLSKLRTIDGRLEFHVAKLLSATPSMFRTLDATAVLDHARLTVAPLASGLTHGRIAGRGVVDHPAGQALPRLALDLRLTGGRLEDVITTGNIAGPLRGHAIMTGYGSTIRAAVARGDGRIGIAAQGGTLNKTVAEMLGRNLGAAIGLMIGGSHATTPLRCIAARLVARRGVLRPTLFAIDTGVMRADGSGRVNLDGETLALTFYGQPKNAAFLRLPGPIEVRGTLSKADVEMRGGSYRSAGTILKALGRSIGSIFRRQQPRAADADCGALIARAGA